MNFLPRTWLGATHDYDTANWVLVGMPYDGTTSNRPGTRFGPAAAREASFGLETYSPRLNKDTETDCRFYDVGDLEFPAGNREKTLEMIYQTTQRVLADGKRWLGVGGEHLVTFPTMKAYVEKYPDLGILHFDAHADLRQDYLGEPLSHATVLRRCVELISPERLVQIGIRSGPKDEFAWMVQHETLVQSQQDYGRARSRLMNRPVFVTIDLDVLDPSVLPGTGTPEPGGMSFNDLVGWLYAFRELNVVGIDVVELSPHYDPSGVSSAVAAKVLREALLTWS